MKRLLTLLVVSAPAIAFAQPAPPPEPPPPPGAPAPPPPPPPASPYDPNAGTGPYAPAPNGPPPAGQPTAPPSTYGQPPPTYGYQPYQYQQPTPLQLHNGMTFEASLGIGWLHNSEAMDDEWSDAGGALALGVGGWVTPQIAITGRVVGVNYTETIAGTDVSTTNLFFGGSLQYWVDNHLWFGGGLGLARLALTADGYDDQNIDGYGLDLRAGYTFNEGTENTFNVSLELTPETYDDSDTGLDATITGLSINVGYQHL